MNQLTERYKIARLIARKVAGTLTGEEADFLEKWTEESGGNGSGGESVEGRSATGAGVEPGGGMESFSTEIAPEEYCPLVVVCSSRGGWSMCCGWSFAVAGCENSRAVSTIRGE